MDVLTKAAAAGDLNKVKKLLDPRQGYLSSDSEGGDRTELGGSHNPKATDINAQSNEFPIAPLHAAVMNCHENVVRFLLTQPGINLNITDTGGYTPLLLAAGSGDLNVLKAVFETSGVDKDATNKYEEDALMCASKAGHLEIVKYLVPRVENIGKKNHLGYTAVSLAASEGHLEIVKHLTTFSRRKLVDINSKSEDTGRTLLMLAAMSGSLKVVQYILETKWCQSIELEATDFKGSTVLMLTAAVGYSEIVLELCKCGADVTHANDGTGYNALMLASRYGHHKTVEVLLKQRKINIMADDHLGRNALFLAAQENKSECVRVILEKYCFIELVNAVTNDGEMTALTATYDPEIKLQLIRANGCDVRTIPKKQTALRRNIRQAIADAGEYNNEVWSNILNKKEEIVLPILALMAEDLKERDISEGFWSFLLGNSIGKEYQSGNKSDQEQNTIYHYLARSQYAAKCRKALKILISNDDLATVLGLQNKQGNTILHIAANCGNLMVIFKIIEAKMGGIADQCVRMALKIENNDKQTFIAAAIKSTSNECVTHVQGIMETLMNLHPRGYDMNYIYKTCDAGGNTLLHLAAKREKSDMISYLADKPIDERALNEAGFNPLHIAVFDNNFELFEHIFTAFKHRFRINEPTGENETVLHIAAKQGNIKMLQKFVELGGDMSSQDNDGHTPLHDCLQQVHLEGGSIYRERCDKFRAVWNKVVDVAVTWWCGPAFLKVPVPDEDSQVYQDFRRDAVYYLRSVMRNKKGFSVLQYAAYLGLTACVETMLTQEHVFVTKHYTGKCGNTYEFEIEITNLLPEYEADIEYKYQGYEYLKEEISKKRKYKGRKTTLIETLAEVKPPLKASEMLQCVPMFRLTKWQWYIYQFFSIVWLISHCAVMTYCSLRAETEIRNFPRTKEYIMDMSRNDSSRNENSTSGSDSLSARIFETVEKISEVLILIYVFEMFMITIGLEQGTVSIGHCSVFGT